MSKSKLKDLRALCSQCGAEARRVVTVMEEHDSGDMAAIFIKARQFIHIAKDGHRKVCRENLPHPFLMTLCGMDEIRQVKEDIAAKLAKWDVGRIIPVVG